MIETEKSVFSQSILNLEHIEHTLSVDSTDGVIWMQFSSTFLASTLFLPFKGWFPICLRHRNYAMIIHSTGTLYRQTEVIS